MDVPATIPVCAPALARTFPRPATLRAEPRLSVVIVNYHTWHDTSRLVRQLRTAPALRRGDAEVVVVDNHSPPHPAVPRLRRLEGVSLRRWRHNRGFGRAANEGCRLSRGDWVLLLNPDMTLEPGFLDSALARAEHFASAHPSAGVIGFRLLNPDGSPQHSAGPFPTLLGTLARLVLPRSRRKYQPPALERPSRVDWVTGCCLLVRRACWQALGGLDPRFFLYYEDVDLCRRARDLGWTVWYDPAPAAVHHRPLHARPVPPALRLVTRHALLTYARKHWAPWQFQALAGIVRVEALVRRAGACLRRDPIAGHIFAELGGITAELARGHAGSAGRRLLRVVRRLEHRRAESPFHCHPQPQPA